MSGNQKRTLKRRTVLQSVGTTGMVVGGVFGTVSAQNGTTRVEKLEGGRKRRLIASLLSSEEVKKIRSRISEPIRPEPQTGRAFQVVDEGESYRIAGVTFSTPHDDSPSYFFIWNDKEDEDIPDNVIAKLDTDRVREERYYLEDGSVTKDVAEAKSIAELIGVPQEDTIRIQSTGDPDECAEYISRECSDVNWSCALEMAALQTECAVSILFASLAGILGCVLYGGFSVWQAEEEVGCELCADTEVREIEVCGPSSP